MTQCVVLDGWHKGHVVLLPDAPPKIALLRPKVVTWCACNAQGEPEPFDSDPARVEYLRCMVGTDREVAAYSLKGDSHALLNGRDWVTGSERDFIIKRKPLYENHTLDVDCRDERAWT